MATLVRFRYRDRVKKGVLRASGKGLVIQCPDYEQLIPLEETEILPPCLPSKIIGIGPNYQQEGKSPPKEPSFFFKPPSSVIGTGSPIKLPSVSNEVTFEPELAVIIGRQARNVRLEEAENYIAGYTCANDVTAIDLLALNFNAAKSFDTFTPLGPWMVTSLNPRQIIRGIVNGKEVIRANLADIIFPPAYLIAYLSQIMTLEPDDVILTGAPARYSPVKPGDIVSVEIVGIGRLVNEIL
ncbi:fumarylacetoacetate hydrolase family protein [Neomoorella humiferrea]|uniref:fumarylacetoacetate hydrolase family protein n=1 Tax=Neomoorella humiferrea TaxID=676965 RepID=UPI003D8ED83A